MTLVMISRYLCYRCDARCRAGEYASVQARVLLPVLGDDPSTPETVETDFATCCDGRILCGLVGLVIH